MSEHTARRHPVRARPRLVVLTGISGAGKTTLCLRATALARERSLSASGVVTLPQFKNDKKAAMFVQNVATGEQRLLGRYVDVTGDPVIEHWQFSDEGVAWGAQILQQATPCDLLIVDELGPLELVYGRGWNVALRILQEQRYAMAIVAVRPQLLPQLLAQVNTPSPVATVDVNSPSVTTTFTAIERWIEELCDSR
jgi:nucleoside-triphosphatase